MVVKKISPVWPYLEATISLLILYIIDYFLFPDSYGFRELAFNPLWIPIFLIAGRYGTAPAVFTGFLCALYYFYFGMIESFFYGEFSLTIHDRVIMFCMIFFSALLGQMFDRILNNYWRLDADHDDLKDQFNNLLTHHWALQKANMELEKRIVRRQTTMKTLYDMARNLESLEEKALHRGVIDIMTRFIKAQKCCFFIVSATGKVELAESKGYRADELTQLVEKKTVNRLFLSAMVAESAISFRDGYEEEIERQPFERCLMAAPLRHEQTHQLLGILTIDDAPLLAFNSGNMRIFNIIADWTARALIKSSMVTKLKEKEIDNDEVGTYSYKFFNTRLAEEASRFMRHNTQFSVAVLRINHYEKIEPAQQASLNQALKEIFARSIRFHDLICRYRSPDMFAILFPLSEEIEGTFHLKRLMNNISMAQIKPYGNDNHLSISVFLQTVRDQEPEPMYRLKPEEGAEIVKKAIETKIARNETII